MKSTATLTGRSNRVDQREVKPPVEFFDIFYMISTPTEIFTLKILKKSS